MKLIDKMNFISDMEDIEFDYDFKCNVLMWSKQANMNGYDVHLIACINKDDDKISYKIRTENGILDIDPFEVEDLSKAIKILKEFK